MKGDRITYEKIKGYKYKLYFQYSINIGIKDYTIYTEYLTLLKDGLLLIKQGYCWDGPSGPTIDTLDFMRGSLVHDALYQLIRENLLPVEFKISADKLLKEMCIEDGMSELRANYVFSGVNLFGKSSCKPGTQICDSEIYVAP